MKLIVGSHGFSAMDARRTLAHAAEFLDAFDETVVPYQADRRARIAAATAGIDAMKVAEAELADPLALVWAELLGARDDVAAAGALPPAAAGRVERLSVSGGGVPKLAVDRVEVDHGGIVGDRQATRRHHGSPFQALCIWNVESIDELVLQGHPIGYGSAGENVTVAGLDWATMRPGTRLRIGTVLCEISSYAQPCKQNARWFSDGDFTRIHESNGPWSRIYATVLEPGEIVTGDDTVVEPVES